MSSKLPPRLSFGAPVRDARPSVTPKRLLLLALAFGLLVTSAVTVPRLTARAQTGDDDLVALACSLPTSTYCARGADGAPIAPRSSLHPEGAQLRRLGPAARRPVGLLGGRADALVRARVRAARGSVDRPVTLAGIAPTVAELLHFDGYRAIDGQPMARPSSPRDAMPKLVVTMVWDAGGINVLDEWPGRHPYLDKLIEKGTWYEDASVGSSPTSTAQVHATIGTGAFPNTAGSPGTT